MKMQSMPKTFQEIVGQHPDFSSGFKELKALSPDKAAALRAAQTAHSALLSAPPAVVPNRVDQANLGPADQQAFVNAVTAMVNGGQYAQIAAIHADMSHNMHGSMGAVGAARFLAWHRRYLLEFERALQQADLALRPQAPAPLQIPYWRWQDPFPAWLQGVLPAQDPRSGGPCPPRTETPPAYKPMDADVNYIIDSFQNQDPGAGANDYDKFTYGLEGWGQRADGSDLPAHNSVHAWVGGIMNDTSYSPTDPIFWLHHAEVDRLWNIWELQNTQAHPNLTGADAVMDPWPEAYGDLVSINALGYGYDSINPY